MAATIDASATVTGGALPRSFPATELIADVVR